MPSYELSLIMRNLSKPELKSSLKRAAETILSQGGLLRSIQNLGTRELPFKMKKDGRWYKQGAYYIYHFEAPPTLLKDISEEYSRDIDIIRAKVSKVEDAQEFDCTLHEEVLPPAYRPEVHKLIELGRKKEVKRFNFYMDYYPF